MPRIKQPKTITIPSRSEGTKWHFRTGPGADPAWDARFSCHLHAVVFHPLLAGESPGSVFWEKYLHPLTGEGAYEFQARTALFQLVLLLLEHCIQKAAQLLERSALSVSNAGALCAFQDASYFAKTFHAQKGCSPSQYRERER